MLNTGNIITPLVALLLTSQVIGLTSLRADDPEPVKGEDLILVPEKSDGLSLHNAFQSNMVLQRDKDIKIWGWSKPGEEVSVSLGESSATAKADTDGSWNVTLPEQEATSTPQQLTVKSASGSIHLDNILIGDVWVLGGQSNMEFEIAKLVNGNQEIVSANFDKIRHITIPYAEGPELKSNFPVIHQWSSWSSRHFKKGEWEVCTPESVRLLSGIGYIFARRLHMATGVPIGIIDASRGGTTVETWTPMNVLEKIDTEEVKALLETWDTKIADFDPKQDLEDRIKKHHEWIERQTKAGKDVSNKQAPTEERVGPAGDPNRPGNCYAGILAPLRGLPVKGAIWHQGYNNALGSETAAPIRYHQIFSQMIPAWRDTFGDPDMPFGIISLCTGGEPQDENDYLERMLDNGVAIRAVQYQTFLDFQKEGDEHIGFASSYDQRRSWYHPQIKIPVGERIARWALATEYDLAKELKWEPTRVEEVIPEPGRLLLKLTGQVIAFNDGPLKGFAVAGDDKKFQPATAEYLVTGKDARGRDQTDRKVIVLTSPLVENPTHYRFAWARNPLANVANSDGTDTPMATQRSDTWSLADLYEAYTGNKTEVSGELSRSERGQLAKALKEADLQRRLHAAKTLLEEHADTLNTN